MLGAGGLCEAPRPLAERGCGWGCQAGLSGTLGCGELPSHVHTHAAVLCQHVLRAGGRKGCREGGW